MARKTRRDVVILNDFRVKSFSSKVNKEGVRTKRGTKTTIEFKAEEIAFDFDPVTLGSGPAKAILGFIADDYAKINKRISRNTEKQRHAQVKAFQSGKDWATKRFSGGRIGDTPPDANAKTWGINSGRMMDNWFVRLQSRHRTPKGTGANKGTPRWFINMPKNRGVVGDFKSTAAFKAFFKELKRQVPALDAAKLVTRKGWREALEQGVDDSITKLTGSRNAKRAQLRRIQRDIARKLIGF